MVKTFSMGGEGCCRPSLGYVTDTQSARGGVDKGVTRGLSWPSVPPPADNGVTDLATGGPQVHRHRDRRQKKSRLFLMWSLSFPVSQASQKVFLGKVTANGTTSLIASPMLGSTSVTARIRPATGLMTAGRHGPIPMTAGMRTLNGAPTLKPTLNTWRPLIGKGLINSKTDGIPEMTETMNFWFSPISILSI